MSVPERFRGPGRFVVREQGGAVYFGDADLLRAWDEVEEAPGRDLPPLPDHLVLVSHENVSDWLEEDEVAWLAQVLNAAVGRAAPHPYELPDSSIDPPCAVCGGPPEAHE